MTDRISKFIASLDPKTRERLKAKLLMIKSDSFSTSNIKKLQNHKNIYRFRLGKIRIIYTIVNNEVEIIDIDYRGNIY